MASDSSSSESDSSSSRAPSPPPREVNARGMGDNWCSTKLKFTKYRYMWTINSFSYSQEGLVDVIKSSVFSTGDRYEWCLRLSPKGLDEDSEDYISLYLISVSCKAEVKVKFKFSILNSKREETVSMESQRPYRFVKGKDWGFKKFVKRDLLLDKTKSLVKNDKLTIFCEIMVLEENVNITGYSNTIHFKVPECRLIDDFTQLFESQQLSDTTLVVNDREFRAHKAILAARSPVFAEMFNRELNESRVAIIDIDSQVFNEILRFIYTGKVDLTVQPHEILAAANKYSLNRLKIMCEEVLSATISIDNAIDIFILADLHRAEQLKLQAIEFIHVRAAHVMSTNSWKSMVRSHPHLVAEAFRALATDQTPPAEPPRKRAK